MERWAVIFDNDMTDMAKVAATRDAHHAYLRANRAHIRMAGAIRDDGNASFVGGIWIIEGCTRDEAARLIANAPFVLAGIHKSHRLVWWGSAPGFENAAIVET